MYRAKVRFFIRCLNYLDVVLPLPCAAVFLLILHCSSYQTKIYRVTTPLYHAVPHSTPLCRSAVCQSSPHKVISHGGHRLPCQHASNNSHLLSFPLCCVFECFILIFRFINSSQYNIHAKKITVQFVLWSDVILMRQ